MALWCDISGGFQINSCDFLIYFPITNRLVSLGNFLKSKENFYKMEEKYTLYQGSYRSLKTWKVLEFENLDSKPGKSLNICKGL